MTRVMGILNTTPDSFSDGGWWEDRESALRHAVFMAESGADIIDVGGESTRPGAIEVSVQEEMDRVVPVVESVLLETDVTVSVDLGSDTVIDTSQVWNLGDVYTTGLGVVRLGGPSNLSSAGGGGFFDDIYLAQVPEPTVIGLGALGLLTLAVRRRIAKR